MVSLDPDQIFRQYNRGEIDKSSAIGYFISIIEVSSEDNLRIEALSYLCQIEFQSEVLFEFLENLLISDDHKLIKAYAAKFLIQNHPAKAYDPIKWALENFEWETLYEKSSVGLCSILNDLRNANDPKLNTLLDLKPHIVYKDEVFLVHDNRLKLNNLDVSNIEEIEGLEKLNDLKELNLSKNNIRKIKALDTLINLKKIDLSHNNISQIEGLESLMSLEQLYLNNNIIEQINGVETLIKLKYLNLNSNKLTEIKGLTNNIELNTLYLGFNKIKKIENLDALENLFFLALNHNEISEIKGLENLVNLRILRLSENNIEEIKGLNTLKKLTTLNLSYNKIRKTCDPNLPHLYFFSLDHNEISRESIAQFYKEHRVFRFFHYF